MAKRRKVITFHLWLNLAMKGGCVGHLYVPEPVAVCTL